MTVAELARAIKRLPEDEPVNDPRKWYRTQKQHWLGWLAEYAGPGAYGRKTPSTADARHIYNRIVEYRMLLWLAEAASVSAEKVGEAKRQAATATSLQQAAGRVRRLIPWEDVEAALAPRHRAPIARLLRRR